MSDDRCGKIQTVLGCISPSEAGNTLAHEHLCCDAQALSLKSRDSLPCPDLCDAPVNQETLWWINQHPYSSLDNAKQFEAKNDVVEEMKFFKTNGGGTVVENSTYGLKRDVRFMAELSKQTGVNVVAGTGYYVEGSRPDTVQMKIEEMAAVMTKELTQGCDGTDIKAGVIGEVGCSWPFLDSERRAIQASAHVQTALGCPVIVHPGRDPKAPAEIVRLYLEAGGSADRLVMSHIDRTIIEIPDLLEFAKLGCYVEFDLFGIETSNYQLCFNVDMPSDAQRIERIKALMDAGYQDRITVGHDIHTKHRLMKYGGHGFSHILLNVVPKMLVKGFTQNDINKILKENPQRWLTFK